MSRRIARGLGLPFVTALAALRSVAAERPERPELAIPRLPRAPVVDGVFSPGEWDRAAAVTGFIAATGEHGGRMVPADSAIYLCHDGNRLYAGVRCGLPPGVKPSMNYRRRDEPVYMDSYQTEIWLSPPERGKLKAYQMIGNAYGAIYDVEHIPALGAANPGWNGDWEFKNTYKTGEQWTAELSIPFEQLDPLGPDLRSPWGGMVAVAWPQRSWPYTFGFYKNVETHARLRMAEGGACVRVEDLSSLFDNVLAPRLVLVSDSRSGGEFVVRAQVGDLHHEERLTLRPGESRQVSFRKELPPPEAPTAKRSCRLTVLGPGGERLLAGDWFFAPVGRTERAPVPATAATGPWKMNTRVSFAPLAMGLKAWADVLDYPARTELARVRFLVRGPDGSRVASEDVTTFAFDSAERYLWLPKDAPFGTYRVETQFLDRGGAVLDQKTDSFEHRDLKKEFAWLGTDVGKKRTVAPPFEPLRVESGGRATVYRVWGRKVTLAGAFPSSIESQGSELLARPISLVAVSGGRTIAAEATGSPRVGVTGDVSSEFAARQRLAGLDVQISGTVEFDGMLLYKLSATKAQSREAPVLDRLYLSIPVRAERATYYFSTGGGWQPSFGLVGELAERGVGWSSRGLADFVPYVCLGDDERGLHWFADGDHGWVLGSDAPCAEIVRERDAVELRINLVRRRGPVERLEAVFGLMASPVKPLPEGWRNACLHYHPIAQSRINFFYGPGHGGCPIDPHDTEKLARAMKLDLKGRDPDEVLRELPARREVFDDERHIRAVLGDRAWDFITGERRRQAAGRSGVRMCYFFNAKMYFEGDRSKAFRTFFPGDWTLEPPSGWFHLTPVESYRDFFSFYMDIWFKHWFVPGLYFDEVYLAPDSNVFNGQGRVMPDGSVRPSFALLHQRELLNRMRQLFLDHGQEPFIWVHTSNYMAPHAISAADIAMFGEDRTPTPHADIVDTIPSLLFRTLGRAQKFGFVPVWMGMAGRSGPGWSFAARQTCGWCWMHDVVPEYHTCERGWPVAVLRQGWGIDREDVQFVPFWDPAGRVATDDPLFVASAWTRPGGKLLLQVMNLHREGDGRTETTIRLAPARLGLPPDCTVYDAESVAPLVEGESKLREADEARNRQRVDELVQEARNAFERVKYDKGSFKVVSRGVEFKLAVPARDFRTLVIE